MELFIEKVKKGVIFSRDLQKPKRKQDFAKRRNPFFAKPLTDQVGNQLLHDSIYSCFGRSQKNIHIVS